MGDPMYPECRHIKTNGSKCCAPALRRSYWCYFHDQLHRRVRRAGRPPRPDSPSLQLTPLPAPGRQIPTLDHGHIPVPPSGDAPEDGCLRLPVLEDHAAVQFALNDTLHALAANRIDSRRAGLLLYGLQIASQNSRHVNAHHDPVRAVTYTAEGSPLGPAIQGWDIEDLPHDEDDDDDDEEDGEEER